jgi:hypothetical protein
MRLGSVVMLLVAGTNAGKRGATVTGSITSERTRECPTQLCEILSASGSCLQGLHAHKNDPHYLHTPIH